MNATTVERITPLTHDEAMDLAAVEYRRFGDLLDELSADDWRRATDCTEWDVRALVSHVVAGCEACASFRESIRQQRAGARIVKQRIAAGEHVDSKMLARLDAMNAFQVRERAPLTGPELRARFHQMHPRALRGRRRVPRPVRAIGMKMPDGRRASVGGLLDFIFTIDTWMHRVDITRATGRPLSMTPEHDGRVVARVVAEWATGHTDGFRLVLTGPAGGNYERGVDGELLEIDAVEFCRILSGRGEGDGLLKHKMMF